MRALDTAVPLSVRGCFEESSLVTPWVAPEESVADGRLRGKHGNAMPDASNRLSEKAHFRQWWELPARQRIVVDSVIRRGLQVVEVALRC